MPRKLSATTWWAIPNASRETSFRGGRQAAKRPREDETGGVLGRLPAPQAAVAVPETAATVALVEGSKGVTIPHGLGDEGAVFPRQITVTAHRDDLAPAEHGHAVHKPLQSPLGVHRGGRESDKKSPVGGIIPSSPRTTDGGLTEVGEDGGQYTRRARALVSRLLIARATRRSEKRVGSRPMVLRERRRSVRSPPSHAPHDDRADGRAALDAEPRLTRLTPASASSPGKTSRPACP